MAAHGRPARPPRAGRVLGLLPRQLDSHTPLPDGLARALRGRRPARDRGSCLRVSAVGRARGRRRARSSGWGSPTRSSSTPSIAIWERLRQPRLARPLSVRPARHALRAALRRGRLRRDRAGDPRAPRTRGSRCWNRDVPRTSRGHGSSPRPRMSRDPTAAPTAAGGVWAVLDGQGWIEANGRRVGITHPGAYELISHPHSTEGELELRVGPGVESMPSASRPGSIRRPRSSSSRLTSCGAPSSPRMTAKPGRYGLPAGESPIHPLVVDPAPRVEQRDAAAGGPLGAVVAGERPRAVGVAEDHVPRLRAEPGQDLLEAMQAALAKPRGGHVGAQRARGPHGSAARPGLRRRPRHRRFAALRPSDCWRACQARTWRLPPPRPRTPPVWATVSIQAYIGESVAS